MFTSVFKRMKYIEKEKTMIRYITDELEITFDDSDKEDQKIILTVMSFLREQYINNLAIFD